MATKLAPEHRSEPTVPIDLSVRSGPRSLPVPSVQSGHVPRVDRNRSRAKGGAADGAVAVNAVPDAPRPRADRNRGTKPRPSMCSTRALPGRFHPNAKPDPGNESRSRT
jgi:hypothetical protein